MLEVADILRVIAISSLAGGTPIIGGILANYAKFSDDQMLFFTAFGAVY